MRNIFLTIIIIFISESLVAQTNSKSGTSYSITVESVERANNNSYKKAIEYHFIAYSNKLVQLIKKAVVNSSITISEDALEDTINTPEGDTTYVITNVLVTDIEKRLTYVFNNFTTSAKKISAKKYDSIKIGLNLRGVSVKARKKIDIKNKISDTILSNHAYKYDLFPTQDSRGKDSILLYCFYLTRPLLSPFTMKGIPNLNGKYSFAGIKYVLPKDGYSYSIIIENIKTVTKKEIEILDSLIKKCK